MQTQTVMRPDTDAGTVNGPDENARVLAFELAQIPFKRLVFDARVLTPMLVPPYKGAALRGGFGRSLLDLCRYRRRLDIYQYIFETSVMQGSERLGNCEEAPRPYVIEPPLDSRTEYAAGDTFQFSVVLVGEAVDYVSWVIDAFELLGRERGLGRVVGPQGRGRFDVESVGVLPARPLSQLLSADANGNGPQARVDQPMRPPGQRLTDQNDRLESLSYSGHSGSGTGFPAGRSVPGGSCNSSAKPLDVPALTSRGDEWGEGVIARIKDDSARHLRTGENPIPPPDQGEGRWGLSDADLSGRELIDGSHLAISFLTPLRMRSDERFATVPEFHVLIRNLLRRASNLAYFHCGTQLDLDFRGLVEAAQQVELVSNRTKRLDWERYSFRRDERLKLGGLVGEAEYVGELAGFLPLLRFGEQLHVGKGVVFGLGLFKIADST